MALPAGVKLLLDDMDEMDVDAVRLIKHRVLAATITVHDPDDYRVENLVERAMKRERKK